MDEIPSRPYLKGVGDFLTRRPSAAPIATSGAMKPWINITGSLILAASLTGCQQEQPAAVTPSNTPARSGGTDSASPGTSEKNPPTTDPAEPDHTNKTALLPEGNGTGTSILPGGDPPPNVPVRPPTMATIEQLGGIAREEDGKIVFAQLSDIPVNDDDLPTIAGFKNLKTLYLSNTLITDDGLTPLRALTSLESLNVAYSRVGDVGLKQIGAIKSLKQLNLFKTRITDAGIAELTALPNLEELKLQRTSITDECIPSLSKLKSLKELWVRDTKITLQGIEKLQVALPHAIIRN